MARRKVELFNEQQLVELRDTLSVHETVLVAKIKSLIELPDSISACKLLDLARFLATTRMMLEDEGQVATAMYLVKATGEPKAVPMLDQCGLEEVEV